MCCLVSGYSSAVVATLETLSRGEAAPVLMKLKIQEFLQCGLHGEGSARKSYSKAQEATSASASTSSGTIAVATTEADEAIASSDFLKIMGSFPQKEPTRVILVSFDHFASSDFNVWLWLWVHQQVVQHQL